jgi:Arc/MetJ family transcription regulator
MAILNIYVKIQLKRTKDKKTYVGLALDRIVQISGAAVDSANFV